MTLDEIIMQFDEKVKEQEDKAEVLRGDFYRARRLECLKLADEYRQVTILLRELKAYREAYEKIKKLPIKYNEIQGITRCINIIEDCLEEVNADDN